MENYRANSLHRGEYTERILTCVKFEAEDLLRVRVHCSIHESPREREGIDQDALSVLTNHQKAENPDESDTDDISEYASLVTDSVNYLAHK